VPFSEDLPEFVMKALAPAKVTEVRIHEEIGTAEVIVPDYQLSLAIGREGQNARLAHRLVGLRVDIKSETQLREEESGEAWAEGEWITDPETGAQLWQPADGGPAISAEEWNTGVDPSAEASETVEAPALDAPVDDSIVDEPAEDAGAADSAPDEATPDDASLDASDDVSDDASSDEPSDAAGPDEEPEASEDEAES